MSTPRPVRQRPPIDETDDAYQRVIPFEGARSARPSRSRASLPLADDERDYSRTPAERRARRQRNRRGGWLQRNALSVAAVALIVVLLGVGFGLAQLLTRGPAAPASTAATAAPTALAGSRPVTSGQTGAAAAPASTVVPAGTAAPAAPRPVELSVRALDQNYTVVQGDSLGAIATRFHTTIARIQAFNQLADPRQLSIGQKLIVPPPL